MSDSAPNPELLRSLGRLVRGLSALFWGLPLTLLVCVGTLKSEGHNPYTIFPPLATTGLLLFGLWQLGSFQRQERPWRNTLDRTRFLAIVNFGLSPFLYWWNRVPAQVFFTVMVGIFVIGALVFLFMLNLVLLRLGAMLPDETLRTETRQYTALNRNLLIILIVLAVAGAIQFFLAQLHGLNPADAWQDGTFVWQAPQIRIPALGIEINTFWFLWLLMCLLVLLPLAMTMALLWKTKEVILDNVFGGNSPSS
jgi:hypothetical protein